MNLPNTDQADDDPYEGLVAQCLEEHMARIEAGETVVEPSVLEEAAPASVQQRIRRAKQCLGLLAVVPTRPLGPRGVIPSASRPPAGKLAGKKRIGRFHVLEELGAGGFGIVYRAWDPRTDRQVALKIPRIETLASEELAQRFDQEARAAARLDHLNIIPVLEAGSIGMLPYIASAYYRGVTLASWLREHREPVAAATAATLIGQLAAALAHAHQRGVLHRDIKPSNILLVPPVDTEASAVELLDATPKLMDFGLAKLADVAGDMTQTGAMLGTIRYMPPEQAAGRSKQIGPASDVYSLGMVLYELLAGEPPFTADTDVEVLRKIETQEPEKFSRARPNVSIDLETICRKCLEKDPARRYASAQSLADDLDRFLQGVPIVARPATTLNRLAKWSRRNPALAALMALATLATVVFMGGLAWSNVQISSALQTAEQQRALATTQARIAEQRERVARKYAYNVDMRLAQEAWENGSPDEARQLLKRHVPRENEEDLRGIEWQYLNGTFGRYSQVVARQPSYVWSLAVAPDNKVFATGDPHGIIRLWRLEVPGLLRELRGHEDGNVDALVFTPDGQTLISAGDDRTIRFWNVASGETIHVLREHANWVARWRSRRTAATWQAEAGRGECCCGICLAHSLSRRCTATRTPFDGSRFIPSKRGLLRQARTATCGFGITCVTWRLRLLPKEGWNPATTQRGAMRCGNPAARLCGPVIGII